MNTDTSIPPTDSAAAPLTTVTLRAETVRRLEMFRDSCRSLCACCSPMSDVIEYLIQESEAMAQVWVADPELAVKATRMAYAASRKARKAAQ